MTGGLRSNPRGWPRHPTPSSASSPTACSIGD